MKTMNCHEVKNLISGNYGKELVEKYFNKKSTNIGPGYENYFCFIKGNSSKAHFFRAIYEIILLSLAIPLALIFLLDHHNLFFFFSFHEFHLLYPTILILLF